MYTSADSIDVFVIVHTHSYADDGLFIYVEYSSMYNSFEDSQCINTASQSVSQPVVVSVYLCGLNVCVSSFVCCGIVCVFVAECFQIEYVHATQLICFQCERFATQEHHMGVLSLCTLHVSMFVH